MAATRSTVERAFELARGGQCRSVDDIRRKLNAERFEGVEANLSSPSMKNQLKALVLVASKAPL